MKALSIFVALVAIALVSLMTASVSALYEDSPMYQPLAHDVADIPPFEMTGTAAIAVWMECTVVEKGFQITPASCEGRDLPYMEMYGYDFIPAPEVMREDRHGYSDWSLEKTNSRALRAFWIVDKPIYQHNTRMSMLISLGGTYKYQWLDYETHVDEYLLSGS